MSEFNPEHAEWHEQVGISSDTAVSRIQWANIGAETWLKLIMIYIAKIACIFAWGASFSSINPMGNGIFLADILPISLPLALQDVSVSTLINLTLGALAVILPSVLWHYTLRSNVLTNFKEYFEGNPLRISVAALLLISYGMTIALEVMSLLSRIDDSLDTGPIPVLGEQPEILPLAIASAALVLGSCLLGLASASLSRSIHNRYTTRS